MSEALEKLHAEMREMREMIARMQAALQPAGQSRPLTAVQLMDRWAVPGATVQARLDNLAKRCRARGLRAMSGTRGMAATYMLADVLAAEAYSNGSSKRRRTA
jgi:hypothetical protein